MLVGQPHEQGAAHPRLQVLRRDAGQLHRLLVGLDHRRDRDDGVVQAQPRRGVLGVGQRVLAGPLRRQPDAVHAVGAEGVDGQRGDQRRVDAAGEAEDDRRHAVLVDEVAQPQHQGPPDLLAVAQRLDDRRRARLERRHRLVGEQVPGHRQRADPALGAVGRRRVEGEVDGQQVLDELRCAGEQLAVGGDDQRVAVEDQLVLPADLVAVEDRRLRLGGPPADQRQPQVVLGPLVRRGVGGADEVDAHLPGDAARTALDPEVLADGQRDVDAVQPDDRQLGARHEVPGLVEDAVVGQVPLVVAGDDLAAVEQGGGVARGAAPRVGVPGPVVVRRRLVDRGGPAALGVREVADDDGDLAQAVVGQRRPRGRRGRARWRARRTPAGRGPRPDSRSGSSRGRRRGGRRPRRPSPSRCAPGRRSPRGRRRGCRPGPGPPAAATAAADRSRVHPRLGPAVTARRGSVDGGPRPAYRRAMPEWLTIEVVDGEVPASGWRRAHENALIEAAITHGASFWEWHGTRWGVVLELVFDSDERLERFRVAARRARGAGRRARPGRTGCWSIAGAAVGPVHSVPRHPPAAAGRRCRGAARAGARTPYLRLDQRPGHAVDGFR